MVPAPLKNTKQAIIVASDILRPLAAPASAAFWGERFKTIYCETGRALIDRLRRRPFHCAIIQDQLEDCDCWRLAKIIRSGRFCAPALPIVVLHRGAPSAGFEAIAKSLNAVPASLSEPDAIPRIVQAAIDQRRRSSVLIIEDDPDAAETARRALDADYKVEIAINGADGLSLWKEKRHDLVLLDLMLPALPGEEVLKEILAVNPKQPVIIVTAHASQSRHSNLMLLGANEFVEKPFDINVLRALCRSLFQEMALARADREIDEMRAAARENAHRATAASISLRQGNASGAAMQLDAMLAGAPQDLTDDEWVEVLNDVEKSEAD